MATKIVTKNSSTAGAAPTAIDLVQGELAVNVADKRLYTEDSVGGIVELGTNPSAEIVANGGIALPDNGKAIFGAGSDLQIYHDGSDSVIAETGTGNLALWGNNIKLLNAGGTETMLDADPNGAVTLYYNDVTRLATSGAGIDVTGTVVANDLTLGDSSPTLTFNDSDIANLNHYITSASNANLYYAADSAAVASGKHVFTTQNVERFNISATGIDVTGTATATAVNTGAGAAGRNAFSSGDIRVAAPNDTNISLMTVSNTLATIKTDFYGGGSLVPLVLQTGTNTNQLYLDTAGNVGIGVAAPATTFGGSGTLDAGGPLLSRGVLNQNQTNAGVFQYGSNVTTIRSYGATAGSGSIAFNTGGGGVADEERMRIDSAGNLLVGKTSPAISSTGVELRPNGQLFATQSANYSLLLNRTTSDGAIAEFRRDGTTVGSIASSGGDSLIIQGTATGSGLIFHNSVAILPARNNAAVDNLIDLGRIAQRFNDAYVTNGVTTGSDGNYKQDIEELNAAETAVAIACKGLLRKWRWIDAVEAKGADARIHFGIIAQDLQAAFEAEGLDAGRYAMFMSNTWWEIQTEVDAVEAVEEVTDEEGNVTTEAVEAKDAYTRTDTFATLEEAPEGATERTRLGIRYSELLAFIIAAI